MNIYCFLKHEIQEAGEIVPKGHKGWIHIFEERYIEYETEYTEHTQYFSPNGDEYDGTLIQVTEDDYEELLTDEQLLIIYWKLYCDYHVSGVEPEIGISINKVFHESALYKKKAHFVFNLYLGDFTPLMLSLYFDIVKHSKLDE